MAYKVIAIGWFLQLDYTG